MIWFVYLITSLTGKYKDKMIRQLFCLLDVFFYFFHLGMYLWVGILYGKGLILSGNLCSDDIDFFAETYIILSTTVWCLMVFLLFVGMFGMCRKQTKIESNEVQMSPLRGNYGGGNILHNSVMDNNYHVHDYQHSNDVSHEKGYGNHFNPYTAKHVL